MYPILLDKWMNNVSYKDIFIDVNYEKKNI